MGKRKIQWALSAWEEYVAWQETDRKTVRRINQLIAAIGRDPFSGIGKPEPLKGNLSRLWSRRIDDHHRLVYLTENEVITIFSCRGHYDD